MGVEVDVVTKPEYDGRQKVIDERFVRDSERIKKIEEIQADMVKLNAQFAEIIKNECEKSKDTQDDVSDMKQIITRLDEVINTLNKNDEDRNARITKLENEPKNKWDRLIGWIGGAGIGYIMNLILH